VVGSGDLCLYCPPAAQWVQTLSGLSGDSIERVPLKKVAGQKRPLDPDLYRLAGVLSALPER
jgi:hypothetical protein